MCAWWAWLGMRFENLYLSGRRIFFRRSLRLEEEEEVSLEWGSSPECCGLIPIITASFRLASWQVQRGMRQSSLCKSEASTDWTISWLTGRLSGGEAEEEEEEGEEVMSALFGKGAPLKVCWNGSAMSSLAGETERDRGRPHEH